MKTIIIQIIILLTLISARLEAQEINRSAIQSDVKHLVSVNFGWDYSASIGVGYGYKMVSKVPTFINAQLSVPSGKNILDDLKTKVGLRSTVINAGNFLTTVSAYGVYRQYKSDLVALKNFGSEFSLVSGYYRPNWFIATEFGFDKAITTHIKNSEFIKENNPLADDGWFIPTGGNFHYGIQAGGSIKNFDVNLKLGKVTDQKFKYQPLIPFYLQLGASLRF